MTAPLGLLASTGWASGVNLYLVTALLGLTGRAGWTEMPDLLTATPTIVIATALVLVEFVADKIPYVDNAWDAVHTVVRPLGAAALALVLSGEAEGLVQAFSAGSAGTLAFGAHAAKATARVAVNTSPEPASNTIVSLGEDGLVTGLILLAVNNPALALAAVVVLVLASVATVIGLWKAGRAGWRRLRNRRGEIGGDGVSRISGRPLP